MTIAILGVLATTGAMAQDSTSDAPKPRPVIEALRIDSPLSVDGVLDELAWEQAPRSGDFFQRQPVEFAPSTERTEIQIAYTAEMLYVAVRAYDREPEKIVAGEMGLDVGIFRDDGIVLLFDTFHDRRNAYFFETNPNSSRTDGIVTDEGRDFNIDWDTIWSVQSRIHEGGWTAEFGIPFSSLRFDPASDTWGLQVRRIIKRNEEITFWSPIGLQASLFRMSLAGEVRGLRDLQVGRSLRVTPFVVGDASSARDEDTGRSEDTTDFDAGLDVKWGITDGLTLDLTVNTDFAETEVDEIQTNLTRFPLFFPEKRAFFLENAGIFQFGPNLGPFLQPFFSRRIGISDDGRMVDLEAGARLAGRAGEWSLGFLGARTGSLPADPEDDLEAIPESTWGVARIKRNLGERSFVGLLATHRDQDDGTKQTIFGADYNWKPDDAWDVWLFGAGTDTHDSPGAETGDAGVFGLSTLYRADQFNARFVAWEVGENWEPAAGFTLRNGFRNYCTHMTWEPRPSWRGVRNLFHQLTIDYFDNPDGEKETVEVEFDLFGMQFLSGDFFTVLGHYTFERLDEPFEIFDGIEIPSGEYEWTDVGFFFTTPTSRPLDTDLFVTVGDFFDGDRLSANFLLQYRPNKYFRTRTSWNHNRIELPAGNFTTNIIRQRIEVSFSPDLVLNALIQSSDASESLGINLRLNWHYRPGSDLFVVYNHGWDAPDVSDLTSRSRQLVVKWTWAWQS
ncbi:MAG: carbohydrate binding family 9 domain-containing protein [Thermoanaerobaculia bacterium]|nr:carbohydrate binding family 9 domain-containing protein [Thermoanaerobaculia bacterium]